MVQKKATASGEECQLLGIPWRMKEPEAVCRKKTRTKLMNEVME
jgi:hypothetical protein